MGEKAILGIGGILRAEINGICLNHLKQDKEFVQLLRESL